MGSSYQKDVAFICLLILFIYLFILIERAWSQTKKPHHMYKLEKKLQKPHHTV